MNKPLRFGSLFAGIGGFDLGFERAGMVCAWQVELNWFCRRVLAKHWPDVRRHGDVKTFPPTDESEWKVDVICGGFPCKQTSHAAAVHGRRIGLEGADSGLWYEMLRVVRVVFPTWVVVENVAGAAAWNFEIKSGLEDAGYRVSEEPWHMSSESIGAAHQRRRLFWIANRDKSGLESPPVPQTTPDCSIPEGNLFQKRWGADYPQRYASG